MILLSNTFDYARHVNFYFGDKKAKKKAGLPRMANEKEKGAEAKKGKKNMCRGSFFFGGK